MSFVNCLISNPNKVLYNVEFNNIDTNSATITGDLQVNTIDGLAYPPASLPLTIPLNHVVTGNGGLPPYANDSGLKVTTAFNNVSVEPSSNLDTLSLTSQTSGFNINFPNGQLNKQGLSEHSVLFNDFSISANNGGTVNGAGGQAINWSNTGIDIITQTGCSLRLFINGMTLQFQPASTGNYYFPLTDGVAGQSLKTDGSGNLYWG